MLKKYTNKASTPFLAFFQASGVIFYLVLVALFFTVVSDYFNSANANEFYAPIIMLMFFMISAVITASLVLGRSGVLFWEKHYKESFELLGYTVLWMIFYFFLFVLLALYY